MNSLIQVRPSVQFRCRVDAAGLRYEEILRVAGEANNYQPAAPLVVQSAWNDFYRQPEADQCVNLIDGSKIAVVFPFELSGGSRNQAALSTSGIITNMASAFALCTSSSATSGK
ncbi:hypothetical protein PMI17_01764 [Pantoea sp. GM01]|nr:hypothetical protein PMI17_01764 [Pantoea sp. GM01]